MTQQEAEALVRILKNRNAEEKTSIENVYNVEHRRTEEERNHTMRRIEQRIHTARLALSSASDAKHKAKGKPDWAVCAAEYEVKRAALVETTRELSEMNVYYQGVFRELRNKRDYNYRRLVQQYAKEYAEIMSKVEYPEKAEKVSYWKNKYYALKEEMKKTSGRTCRMTYHELWLKYQRISNINTLRARKKDTPEAYERAQSREKLIMKAFFNDVKRYLKPEDL